MHTIQKVDPFKLSSEEKKALKALVEPSCFHYFESKETANVIFAAFVDSKVIGIILCKLNAAFKLGEIEWVFVVEEYRNRKVATMLFQRLTEEIVQIHYQLLLFSFSSESKFSKVFESFFASLNWYPPTVSHIHCRFDGFSFNPPWLQTSFQAEPSDFFIFPWKELSHFERERIEHQLEKGMVPQAISPFKDEVGVENLNSLGLRHKGAVIGWMITHRVTEDTIKYSSLYIQRQWQQVGIAIKLLSESIKLQKLSDVKWAILEVSVNLTEKSWMRFVERRLIPYALEVTYTKQVWQVMNLATE